MKAQSSPTWTQLPSLPDEQGFAGMFGGVSKGEIFCMGGANFPGKKPWEGGVKKWYNHIYRLAGDQWELLKDSLYMPLGYGVSASYKNRIILAGGNNAAAHVSSVVAYTWTGSAFQMETYPSLPVPVANSSGTLVGDLLIVAGGNSIPAGPALEKCFALDLTQVKKGWFEIDPWPGQGRIMPACASFDGKFYLFSGETAGVTTGGENYRLILQDAFCLSLHKRAGTWSGSWKSLTPMPKGAVAAGLPIPVLESGQFLFWGGVDAVTAAWKDPATHPGNMREVLLYDPLHDSWRFTGRQDSIASRVTLPVISWRNGWVFVSGEIRPGVRTNTVYSVR